MHFFLFTPKMTSLRSAVDACISTTAGARKAVGQSSEYHALCKKKLLRRGNEGTELILRAYENIARNTKHMKGPPLAQRLIYS